MTIVDGHLVYSEVREKLEQMDREIFEGVDKYKLSDYEKRKMIFDYLCNKLKYDIDSYTDMVLYTLKDQYNFDEIAKLSLEKQFSFIYNELKKMEEAVDDKLVFRVMRRIREGKYNKVFTPLKSLDNLFTNGLGLCNSDSQVYKMLLEMNGIYSVVVFCSNGEPRAHALNLVYDKEKNCYSFDDVSSYTAAKENGNVSTDFFFDYDIEYANRVLNQGYMPDNPSDASLFKVNGVPLENKRCFLIFGSSDVNSLFGQKNNYWYKQFGLEYNSGTALPNNIDSVKRDNIYS